MRASIVAVDQSYSLVDDGVSNFLVLELPSGKRLRLSASEEDTNLVIAESQTGSKFTTHGPATAEEEIVAIGRAAASVSNAGFPDTSLEESEAFDHHVDEGVVDWEQLPDTQLPPSMKTVLRASGINRFISIDDLNQLKIQILEHMRSQPQSGMVEWDSGTKRQVESKPRRTVPMDEAGNPLPPGGITELESDPGETQEYDDDDGVMQA